MTANLCLFRLPVVWMRPRQLSSSHPAFPPAVGNCSQGPPLELGQWGLLRAMRWDPQLGRASGEQKAMFHPWQRSWACVPACPHPQVLSRILPFNPCLVIPLVRLCYDALSVSGNDGEICKFVEGRLAFSNVCPDAQGDIEFWAGSWRMVLPTRNYRT